MFKGLGGLGDMGKLMAQAKEMQTKMAEAQEKLESVEVTAEAGAGLVKVTANAKGKLTGLDIDPTILTGEDKEAVEDLIVAAIQDVLAKAGEAAK